MGCRVRDSFDAFEEFDDCFEVGVDVELVTVAGVFDAGASLFDDVGEASEDVLWNVWNVFGNSYEINS